MALALREATHLKVTGQGGRPIALRERVHTFTDPVRITLPGKFHPKQRCPGLAPSRTQDVLAARICRDTL